LTEPWRFTVVAGEARERLGRLWGTRAAEARGLRDEERVRSIERDVEKLLRAPVLIIASTRTDDDSVVAEEDFAATAAAVQNILLAAHARGLGAMWRTGAMVRDPQVKAALGLDARDRIVATVYLGEPSGSVAPERARALPAVWWGDD
jgi:nitroreductase